MDGNKCHHLLLGHQRALRSEQREGFPNDLRSNLSCVDTIGPKLSSNESSNRGLERRICSVKESQSFRRV